MLARFLGVFRLGLVGSVVGVAFACAPLAYANTSPTLVPRADGAYTQWTPSTGTSHYTLVNESVCNGTTNYTYTNTVGGKDSYVVSTSSIPSGATITKIDIRPCASRNTSGTGTSTMDLFYRFGGFESSSTGAYLLTGTTPTVLATTSFSGLSLIQTSSSTASTLEVGAVYTSGTRGARLSQIVASVTYTPLTAPSGLAINSVSTSSIGIRWTDTSSNETGFAIDRSLNGVTWSGLATTSANTTTYLDSGLAILTPYFYRVRAFNSGAYTAYTNVASATTTDNPPAAPSALTAVASTTKPEVDLSWTNNASNQTAFEVLRSLNGVTFVHTATTSASTTTYADLTVASSTTYYYEVRAYNTSGGYSTVSNVASTTTANVPANPTNLTLSQSPGVGTSTNITLTWSDNSYNELGFKIELKISPTSYIQIATVGANVVSYVAPFGSLGSTYTFRVYAYNQYGNSAYSNEASTTVVLPAPSALSAVASTTKPEVDLSWTNNNLIQTAVEVLRSLDGVAFTHLATTTASSTSYTDLAVASSTTYFYEVRSYLPTIYSAVSGMATTTTSDVPASPSGLSLATAPGIGTTTDITLTWSDNSSNKLGFGIEKDTNGGGFVQIATVAPGTTTYLDAAQPAGNTYTYRVFSYNLYGNSAYSNQASTTVQ